MPLRDLLTVQSLDTHIDQLRHQIDSLAERAKLAGVEKDSAALNVEINDHQTSLNDLRRTERLIESEADGISQRIVSLDKQLYGGELTSAKDMQALSGEIEKLQTRRSELDDRALVLIDQIEPLEKTLDSLRLESAELTQQSDDLRSAIEEASSSLNDQISDLVVERKQAADLLNPVLREEYERLRGRLGGVGAAEIVHGTCSGCHVSFSSAELESIHKLGPDEFTHCEQCGRILVP